MGASTTDLLEFLRARDRWGVRWRGAHFVGFAMSDLQGVPTLVLGNLICLTDGVEPPALPEGRFVEAKDAVAISVAVPEEALSEVLVQMGEGRLSPALLHHFGRPVAFANREPGKAEPWYVDLRTYGDRFPRVSATRNSPGELLKFLGYDCIERARRLLLSATQRTVFDGLTDLARQLRFESTHEFSSSSSPVVELTAPVPLRLAEFKYDKVAGGYRVDLECGTSVDRRQGLVSLAPGPRMRLPLDQFEEVRRRNGLHELRGLFPASRSDEKVKAAVILGDEVLFEDSVEGVTRLRAVTHLHGKPKEEWARKLQELFDISDVEMLRRVRALAGKMAPRVAARAKDAIELLSSRPFYSVIASASVVEALLRLRILRYRAARANAELRALGAPALSRAPRRLPLAECIDVAERLHIMPKLDAHAGHLLREARNFVHVDLSAKGAPTYSEAEAIGAFLAALRVIDALRKPRPRRRGVA